MAKPFAYHTMRPHRSAAAMTAPARPAPRHAGHALHLVACLFAGLWLCVPSALADRVARIDITGNERIADETILSYLTIEPGRTFDAADIGESVKALFSQLNFEDVTIEQQNNVLVVTVKESPVIGAISFAGNKRLSDNALRGVTRLEPGDWMTGARVQRDVQSILAAYRGAGRFGASVNPERVETGNNRVDVIYRIDEGENTSIEEIRFVGNRVFSDNRLRDVIHTRERGMFSFLFGSDSYDPDRLETDKSLLRRFYRQNGYADMRIVSGIADLDRERNRFDVTFTIEEGERYDFGEIAISSLVEDIPVGQLQRFVVAEPGRIYNVLDVDKSTENLSYEIGRLGYAFARVNARAERDFENRTIKIEFQIDEGPRVYVERIDITGNDRTAQQVIRREFSIAPGDAFNPALLEQAERRLRNLDYFDTVIISTVPGSASDRIIVEVAVEEKNTGLIGFGGGYSSLDGIIGEVEFEEANFLGRGNSVRAAFGGGRKTRTYELAYTEPFFLGRRIALTLEAYNRRLDANALRRVNERSLGGRINVGLPVIEDQLRLDLFYKIARRNARKPAKNRRLSYAYQDSLGNTLLSSAGFAIVSNRLDNNIDPREGSFLRLRQEMAGLGGDVRYASTTAEAHAFAEFVPRLGVVGTIRGTGGFIRHFGAGRLRVSDQFHIPADYLRGFRLEGIGPKDSFSGDRLGGRMFAAATVETTVPLPLLPRELGISIAFFADAGSVWDNDPALSACVSDPQSCGFEEPADFDGASVMSDTFALRSSIGAGLRWQSPFGPLRFDFAWPLHKQADDVTQIFRFSGGKSF